jgi:hypothetical protein
VVSTTSVGGDESGGHVLRETSRGLCGLVCPSRTSERGGDGDCVEEGGGSEGECDLNPTPPSRRRSLSLPLGRLHSSSPLLTCAGALPQVRRRAAEELYMQVLTHEGIVREEGMEEAMRVSSCFPFSLLQSCDSRSRERESERERERARA